MIGACPLYPRKWTLVRWPWLLLDAILDIHLKNCDGRGKALTVEERVLIAGAGPVGLVAAAHLARSAVPVTVFEEAPVRFDKQRRLVTLEYIQNYTIQNKKNLESSGDEFRQSLQAITADPVRTREYLLRVSMVASLHLAEEIG